MSNDDEMSNDEVVEQPLPLRRGWQLPREADFDAPANVVPRRDRVASMSEVPPRPTPPRADVSNGPTPTMLGGVLGQVTKVTIGSVSVGETSEAIVMLRLERYDAHAGRTSIHEVRLDGDDTIGFASMGDWIEAVGSQKSSHLKATEAINHTTGAVHKRSAVQRHRMAVAAAFFLTMVLIMVTVFIVLVRHGDAQFKKETDQDQQRSRDACLASGAPRSFCEQFP